MEGEESEGGRGALLIRMAMTLVMLMLLQIVRKCQLFSATSKRRRRGSLELCCSRCGAKTLK